MSDYQPRHDVDRVLLDGQQVNDLDVVETGVGVFIEGISGWDGGVDVRDVREPRPGFSGEDADSSFLGGRSVSVAGWVAGSSWSDLQARKRALAGVFAPSSGEVLLKVPEPDAPSYAERVLEFAPAAYLRMGDSGVAADGGYDALIASHAPGGYWKLDEQSGSTVADSSGNGLTLTVNGNPTLGVAGPLEGVTDYAIDLDGTGDFLSRAHTAALNTATYSIGGWFFRDVDSGAGEYLFTCANSTTGYMLNIITSDVVSFRVDGGSGSAVSSTSTVPTGAWTHIRATYDGVTAKVYINGVLEGSGARTGVLANSALEFRIGAVHGGSTNLFSGKVARPSYIPDAMTAREVMDEYLATRPSYKAADSSGNGHHAAAVGGPTFGSGGAIRDDDDTAIDFDGTNDFLVIPYAAALNPAAITIGGWAKRDSDTGAAETLLDCIASNLGYRVQVGATDLVTLTVGTGAGTSATAGTSTIAAATWFHWAVTHSGAEAKVYVNGVLETTAATTYAANTSAALRIAALVAGTSPWNGKQDELFIEPSVLTAAEIWEQYLSGLAGYDHDLPGYERANVKVVESIAYGEINGYTQSFQVGLRASDPLIYNDVEYTATTNFTSGTPLAATTPIQVASTLTASTFGIVSRTDPTNDTIARIGDVSTMGAEFAAYTTTPQLVVDSRTRDAHLAIPQNLARKYLADPVWMYRLNEAAGSTADDYINAAATHDGTINGTPTLNQTGPFTDAKSITFDGVNDYISTAYNATFIPTEFTFEMWFKPDPASTGMMLDFTGTGTKGFTITSQIDIVRVSVPTAVIANAFGDFTEWNHIAITQKDDVWEVFLNGSSMGRVQETYTAPTAGTFCIGREDGVASFWKGNISSVAMHSVAYPGSVISDFYNDGSARSVCRLYAGRYDVQVIEWPYDGFADTTTTAYTYEYRDIAGGVSLTRRAARL